MTKTTAFPLTVTTKELAFCSMFAALIAVVSQLSIPMPTGVPITIQVFAITLTGVVLGSRLGCLATIGYILAGAVGLPVFANFHGGFYWLVGLTGGYIWSYPLMAFLCGIRPKTSSATRNLAIRIGFATLGLILLETIGGLQWAALAGDRTVRSIFVYSMVAFVPKDFLLVILAVLFGSGLRKTMQKAGLTFN